MKKMLLSFILVLFLISMSYSNSIKYISLLIPSYPQFATQKYFRGSMIVLGYSWLLFDYNNYNNMMDKYKENQIYYTMLWTYQIREYLNDTTITYENFQPDSSYLATLTSDDYYYLISYYRYKRLLSYYQLFIDRYWAAGLWVYSFLDGLDGYINKKNREASSNKAILFSAIFPGLGQIYTQSYSSAAVIYLLGIGFLGHAYFNNKLVNDLRKEKIEYFNQDLAVKYIKVRNTYLWYLLGLYIYNIFDAYVEAEFSSIEFKLGYNIKSKSLIFSLINIF